MAKYNFDLKMKVVQAYLNGDGGYKHLAKSYKIAHHSSVTAWVRSYQEFGPDGLMRSKKNTIYTFEFKLSVVELYLTNEVSFRDLAIRMGINNYALVIRWVNDYRIAGPDSLKPKKKGRPSKMKKHKNKEAKAQKNSNNKSDYLVQLEEENIKLRIENTYLKELRRLRLEGTPQKKNRESSTASEDHSN